MSRFQRTEMLIGPEGVRTLAASSVIVFGVGGVGSFAVEALARAGIGRLRLVDHDTVDTTNINRQLPALTSTVGQPKVAVMETRVRDINPDCRVEAVREFHSEATSDRLLTGDWDYVVDAIDSVGAKVFLIHNCLTRQLPIVSSMGAGNKLDPTQFRVTDISKTHTCPLAKVVRKELRSLGWERGVKVVFSPEPPTKLTEGRTPGSISFVPPVAGFTLASIVVRDLLGVGTGGS